MSGPRLGAILSIALLVSVAVAGEKRPTGTVAGNFYRDALYGFTIEKYDNWKFGRIDDEEAGKPRGTRFVLTQKSVNVPTDYLDNEEKFTMPTIGVYVDTSAMPLEAYAAEMADRKSKRAARKDLAKAFPILTKGQFVEQGPFTIDGQKGLAMHFRQDYEVQLYNRVKDEYKLKEDALLGDLYLAKRGDLVYLLHFICEREIYRTVNEEAKAIIMSVDFDPPADTTGGAGSAAPGQ